MATETRRTSVLLCTLALVFLTIIIILAITLQTTGTTYHGTSKEYQGISQTTTEQPSPPPRTTEPTTEKLTTEQTTDLTTEITTELTTQKITTELTTEQQTEKITTEETTTEPTTEITTEELTESITTEMLTTEMTTSESTTELITEMLTTEMSTTELTTEMLTTIPSTTKLATEGTTTEMPTTEMLTTELATEMSTTIAPTTEMSTTEMPTTESTTEIPTTENATEILITEATTEILTTQTTTEPTTEVPTTQTTTEVPTTQTTTEVPTTQTTTEVPTTQTTTEVPTTEATTEVPTTQTTTEVPTTHTTTEVPTTQTTTEVSTTQTTTEIPTTQPPTTVLTTMEPTTELTTEETTTVSSLTEFNQTCKSVGCQTIMVDILAAMDHNSAPCKDFYQYACGGVMRKQIINPRKPDVVVREIIKDQLYKASGSSGDLVSKKMWTFYDSCMKALDQDTKSNWNLPITRHFGSLEIQETKTNTSFTLDLTKTLSDMIVKDFSPFFNIELDVDKNETERFLLSLHPVILESPFSEDLARKVCQEEHRKNMSLLTNTDSYSVDDEYEEFIRCVRSGGGLEMRIARMIEATKELAPVAKHFTGSFSVESLLQETADKTREFLIELSDALPYLQELRGDVTNVINDKLDVDTLDAEIGDVIDWKTLLNDIAGTETEYIQVYKTQNVKTIMNVVKKYYDQSQKVLNNMLVMLWSERLYTDFVRPVGGSVGEEEYCLNAAVTLMPDTTSHLYLKGMTQEDKNARKDEIFSILRSIKWRGEATGRKFLDMKEHMMDEVVIGLDSRIKDQAERNTDVIMTEIFLNNVFLLLKNRWTIIKNTYMELPIEQLWLFMRPYNTYGVYDYIIKKPMIPFGVLEPFRTFQNMPDYLKYAGLGTKISNVLWRGFERTGLTIKNESLQGMNDLMYKYEVLQNHSLPDGPTALFSMDNSSFYEVWSDIRGIELAWDSYLHRNNPRPSTTTLSTVQRAPSVAARRRRSVSTVSSVPTTDSLDLAVLWHGFTPVQLFYLYWAQQYCTDKDEISMFELKESIHPPGRVRVNFVAQNVNLFSQAFKCTN